MFSHNRHWGKREAPGNLPKKEGHPKPGGQKRTALQNLSLGTTEWGGKGETEGKEVKKEAKILR